MTLSVSTLSLTVQQSVPIIETKRWTFSRFAFIERYKFFLESDKTSGNVWQMQSFPISLDKTVGDGSTIACLNKTTFHDKVRNGITYICFFYPKVGHFSFSETFAVILFPIGKPALISMTAAHGFIYTHISIFNFKYNCLK